MSRRYGEIARLWWRTGARGLSPTAKIVELAIRTGPQSTALPGLVEADALVLASVTELSVPDVEGALEELVRRARIEIDPSNTMIAIVDEPSPDEPVKSYKQLLGAWSCYQEMPPSPLRERWVTRYRAAVDLEAEKMAETWARTFGTIKAIDTLSNRVSDTPSIPATASSEQRAAEKDLAPSAGAPAAAPVLELQHDTPAAKAVTRDRAEQLIAESSAGRYIPGGRQKGGTIKLDKARKAHPDGAIFVVVGAWLAAGGDWRTAKGQKLDGRNLGELDAWIAQATAWQADGRPVITGIARPAAGAMRGGSDWSTPS